MPPTLSADLVSSIEREVRKRSLLMHPFYRAWSAGELTLDHLRGYAKEYYWMARHVPAIMEAIGRNLPAALNATQRATFARNAKEEEEHIELWERFAAALGVPGRELERYEPTETVKEAVASIVEIALQGFEEGVAAMYAFECDLPAISESKIRGLQELYGLSSEDAHAYFNEHLAEERHLCFSRGLLKAVGQDKVASALSAAKATVSAQNRILDGICERVGIECRRHANRHHDI